MIIKDRLVEAWYKEVLGIDITDIDYPKPSQQVWETVGKISKTAKEIRKKK